MKPETCPDRQTLEKLLLGDLPTAERESLAEHLLHCDECVGTAETITVGDDLTEALRTRRVMASDQSAVQEVIDRAKELRATGETLEIDETIVARSQPQSADVESISHEEEIDFLAPAEQADELGRFGGYRVLEVLGVGGMGIVFRAEDPQLQRQVALKAMKPAVATSRSAKDRFLREAQATAAIEHDNIVHIYQVGEDLGVPFIAMQFLRGESLQDRLARESRLSPAEVVKIGREMADGLEAAHRQDLVHRDIKPDNIWLEEGSGRVKIVDFGLVRSADSDAGLTQAGMVLGTPRYMAPEQAQGQVVDHRCDLFSLGSVLYRVASGKSPFEGRNITATLIAVAQAAPKPVAEVYKEIDPDLAALIMRLLSKDRDARPQTAAEVSQQLADLGRKIDTSDGVSSTGPSDTLAARDSFPIRPVVEKLPTIVKQPARRTTPRPSMKAGVSGGNNRTKWIAAGLGGALVLLAAIVFFARIGKYDVQITLEDESMSLKIDGESVVIEGNDAPIRLSAGDHTLHVEMNGFESDTDSFTVKKDGKNAVHVARLEGKLSIIPGGKPVVPSGSVASSAKPRTGSPSIGRTQPPGGRPVTDSSDWRPIFDGKTLDGWQLFGGTPEDWKVVDGVLTGTGAGNKLVYTRERFDDVIVRVECRLSSGSNSGVYVRSGQNADFTNSGYEAQLAVPGAPGASAKLQTGAVWSFAWFAEQLIQPDEWFTLEMEARAKRIQVRVNGRTTADFEDDSFTSGHVALQGHNAGSPVEFRKIEILALDHRADQSALPAPPPAAVSPFDAKQARAHQEVWAKHLGTTVETTNSVGAKMVLIPPGEFLMGSTDEQVEAALKDADEFKVDQRTKDRIQNAERPQHKVVLTKPFLIGATEITIGQFKKFSATGYQTEAEKQAIGTKTASPPNASAPSQPPAATPQPVKTYLNPGYSVTDDSPAAQITWNDAVAYCRWLTAQEKVIYRLPTEAEWEFACRAGTTTQYSFGDDAAFLDLYGWYIKNQSGNSQPVGTKLPNAFGLFDMHGNLFEWCQDFWNEKWYELSPTNDPTGSTYIVGWVMRGGCWNFSATHSRSAYRHTLAYRDLNVGFRVVRVLDVPAMTASVTLKSAVPVE